jgi:hypothetical protein
VLGYSTTGNIDWEQMPENMRSWLKQYDMSGRRLAAKPTSKGIYIYKGKKRIIK